MKKGNFLLMFMLIFTIGNFSQLFAQPKTSTTNDPDGSYGSSCIELITVTLELTNLDAYPPAGFDGNEFFPSNLPPMEVNLNVGGNMHSMPLGAFQNTGNTTANAIPIYAWTGEIAVDLCEHCTDSASDSFVEVEVTLSSPNQTHYPACDYNNFDEIFACDHFEAAGSCNGSKPCDNIGLTTGASTIQVNCETVGFRGAHTTNFEIKVYPNPFREFLNIEWDYDAEPLTEILLVQADGKVVREYTYPNGQDQKDLSLDTHDLPSGMYYLKLNSLNNTTIKTVIKQ